MNNAFKKTVLALTAMGVIMGPILPAYAGDEHSYQSNGVANYLDAESNEIGHNGGANRTEKGSPYGWKAGGTFFGIMIDSSDGHWGNKVLSADVNQLIIPASVQHYADDPVFNKAKINTLVAEANGFNNTAEMTAWIADNLSVEYKANLVSVAIATKASIGDVAGAVKSGTTTAAKKLTTPTPASTPASTPAPKSEPTPQPGPDVGGLLDDAITGFDDAGIAGIVADVVESLVSLGLTPSEAARLVEVAGYVASEEVDFDGVDFTDAEAVVDAVIKGTMSDIGGDWSIETLSVVSDITNDQINGLYAAGVAAGVAAGLTDGQAKDAAKEALEDALGEERVRQAGIK